MPHGSGYPTRGQRAATNKNSAYARALRAGSQSQSPRGKRTGVGKGSGAAIGGAGGS